MTSAALIAWIASSIKFATVFLFGSTGETVSEKSGQLNMGIPGIMYLGALGGILGQRIYIDAVGGAANTNSFLCVLMPLIFGILFAGLGGLLYSFFTITLKCNHNVTGLTITTFGVGLSCYFISEINTTGLSTACSSIQSMFPNDWGGNWFGEIFLSQSFFTYFAIIVAIVAALVITRSRIGLNLRACGENPAAADAAGINVNKYRYLASIIGAIIAGIGGLAYELDFLKGYVNAKDAVDAFGWLALSLVIFSMWKPGFCIVTSLFFGLVRQLPYYIDIPTVMQTVFSSLLPYVCTILVLVLTSILNSKSSQPPASLGITYFREDR